VSRSVPPPMTVPRVPEAVVGKRPAEIVAPRRAEVVVPPPAEIVAPVRGEVTGPLPSAPGRRTFGSFDRTTKATPRPVRGKRPWPIAPVVLGLLFVGLFVVAMGLGAATDLHLPRLFDRPVSDEAPPRAFPVLDPSRPQQLSIPAIKVRAPIMDVGRAADGSVDVPPLKRHNEAGWFDGGPTPGQFGPALIVGHADTRTGPSVFFKLGRLKPGQQIEVSRADGSVAVFEINSVEHFDKDKLPVQRVYGDYSRPSLRLMTCGGDWLGGDQGYADNIVVFASLVAAKHT
jgi:sortase family protein